MADSYDKPYIESSVFIAWVRGHNVEFRDIDGEIVDQGAVSEHVIKRAAEHYRGIFTSYLTIAEVFKKKGTGAPRLSDTENGRILKFFENDFFTFVEVDRIVAEEANKLCRRFREYKLLPNDAIHIASAVRAGCDVLYTWDEGLQSVPIEGVLEIRFPRVVGQTDLPLEGA